MEPMQLDLAARAEHDNLEEEIGDREQRTRQLEQHGALPNHLHGDRPVQPDEVQVDHRVGALRVCVR